MLANDLADEALEGCDKRHSFLSAVTTASRLVHKTDFSTLAKSITAMKFLLDASSYYTEALIWLNFFISERIVTPERAQELTKCCERILTSITQATEQIRNEPGCLF